MKYYFIKLCENARNVIVLLLNYEVSLFFAMRKKPENQNRRALSDALPNEW